MSYVILDAAGRVIRREAEAVSVATHKGFRCLPETRPEYDSRYQTISAPASVPPDATEYAWVVDDKPIADVRAYAVGVVKAACGARVMSRLPDWKQRNLTAEATNLLKVGEANWTVEQRARWNAGEIEWQWVTATRLASDFAEIAVLAATTGADVIAVLDGLELSWPSYPTQQVP